MEILLFFIDILAVFVLVSTSLRNDLKQPGEPLIEPFHYDVSTELSDDAVQSPAGRPRFDRR